MATPLACMIAELLVQLEPWLNLTGYAGLITTCEPADGNTPDCEVEDGVTVLGFVATGHGFCVSEDDFDAIALLMLDEGDCVGICQFVQTWSGKRFEISGYDEVNFCVLTVGDVRPYIRAGDVVNVYAFDSEVCPPPDSVHIGTYPALRICVCPCIETGA